MSNTCELHFVEKCPICKPHAGSVPLQPITSADSIITTPVPGGNASSEQVAFEAHTPTIRSIRATKLIEAAELLAQSEDTISELKDKIQAKRDEIENLSDRLAKELKRRDTAQLELRGLVKE